MIYANSVIPAKAGTQGYQGRRARLWTPAFAEVAKL